MASNTSSSDWFALRLAIFGLLLLSSLWGCSHDHCCCNVGLAERILPPTGADAPEQTGTPSNAAQSAIGSRSSSPLQSDKSQEFVRPVASGEPTNQSSPLQSDKNQEFIPTPRALPSPLPVAGQVSGPGPTLDLNAAIDMAFHLQPRLKASLESIEQARGKEGIAYSAFLPLVNAGYSIGGFGLDVGGTGLTIANLPNSPAFNFLPPGALCPWGSTSNPVMSLPS